MNIYDYGFIPTTLMNTEKESNAKVCRVTAVYRDRFQLVSDSGESFARLKAGEYYNGEQEYPTTGDFVLALLSENSDGRIIETLPRRTFFSRRDPDPGRAEQAVAANFDYVFIMQSLNYDFNVRRLERYLTLAWQSGAVPAVILTKADLTEDCSEQIREVEKTAAGVCVFAVSSKTGEGLSLLSDYLRPRKTAVFLGSSGVGKSSLVNALAGKEVMATNDIREDDSKGRHTTTHRQLIMLPSGVMIIDTPGMRELGMWDVTEGLGQSFSDVEQYLGQCKFSDCRHMAEPGCAVRTAIENGELPLERWESYMKLKTEAKYSDDKTSYMRDKQQWHKSIAKANKELTKISGKRKY